MINLIFNNNRVETDTYEKLYPDITDYIRAHNESCAPKDATEEDYEEIEYHCSDGKTDRSCSLFKIKLPVFDSDKYNARKAKEKVIEML